MPIIGCATGKGETASKNMLLFKNTMNKLGMKEVPPSELIM